MPDLLAGTTVRAADTPPSVSATAGNSYDTNSSTYTTGSVTAGTYEECAVTFVAPTTGRVKITTVARLINSSTSGTLVAPETREGSVIGQGAVVEAASDGIGVSHYGNNFARSGVSHMLSGLTPGATYNTRLLHRVSNAVNSGSIALRELIVEPCT